MFRDPDETSYLETLYGDEPHEIRKIRESCPKGLRKMQMSHSECRILSFFLKVIKANKVLELGTLVGCSTAWIATSLSGNSPLVVSVEKSLNNYNLAKKNLDGFYLKERIELLLDDAKEFLTTCKTQFDAIFIDAKKLEYKEYLPLSKKRLRSSGFLIADNTLMLDNDRMPELSKAIHDFNLIVEADPELNSIIIPTGAGMTIATKV